MAFLKRKRLERIIKKSVDKTVETFSKSTPEIYQHFFYGAFDIAPQNLVIWYLFETDNELSQSQESGLCESLTASTFENLLSFGYPPEALSCTKSSISEKIKIECDIPDLRQSIIDALENRQVRVSFTTKEDIDNKANGDYHLYFQ